MSDKCSGCSCADKSQCVKKGNSYGLVVETEKSYIYTVVVMDAPAAEHGTGTCKCGSSCPCIDCTCG